MDKLTDDLVMDILSRLPIKFLIRSRYVCKSWLSLIQSDLFVQMHLNRSSCSIHESPSFIFHSSICLDRIHFLTQLHYLQYNDTHNTKEEDCYSCTEIPLSLPDSREYRVMGSVNGLLCLLSSWKGEDCDRCIYICNPFTSEYVKIPDNVKFRSVALTGLGSELGVGFGFIPEKNEYKVVVLRPVKYWKLDPGTGAYTSTHGSEVYVYTLGHRNWRRKGDISCMVKGHLYPAPFVDSAFYWMGSGDAGIVLVSFDIVDERFDEMPWPGVQFLWSPLVSVGRGGCLMSPVLAVLDGCLWFVKLFSEDHVEMWIMEKDGGKTKMFSINDQGGNKISFLQVLSAQRDGELLMIYNHKDILSYNPQTEISKKLNVVDCPPWFEGLTHVGTLVSPSSCFRNNGQQLEVP